MVLVNSIYEVASDEINNQITLVNDIVKKYDITAIVAGEGPLMKDLIKISDTDFNNVNYSSIICIFIILVICLKAFVLPLLLIISIEAAIFINMSIAYFGGIDKAKFRGKVTPGDTLRFEVEIVKLKKMAGIGKGIAYVGDKKVAEAEMTFMF